MRSNKFACPRRARLHVESLERREVPTGDVTAVISGGVLVLTGDSQDNVVSIEITATDVIVTPDGTTTVNGLAGAQTVPGIPNSMKASFLDGDDSLSITNTVDFLLPGGANVDLGGGGNELNLATNQHLELGSLIVKGGDGDDVVTVSAGAGLGTITGKASIDHGNGSNITVLGEMNISGSSGLDVKSTGSLMTFADVLNATNVQIPGGVKVSSKGGFHAFITGTLPGTSTIGKFKGSGLSAFLSLSDTTVNGNIKLNSLFQAHLAASASTIDGKVDLKATETIGGTSTNLIGTTSVGGSLRLSGGSTATLQVVGAAADTVTVGGNVSVTSLSQNNVIVAGPVFSTKNLSQTGGLVQLNVGGASATINGNLSIKASVNMSANFNSTALSEVKGNLSATGGWFQDFFVTNSFFTVDKNITIKLGDNVNSVLIGNGVAPVVIGGNLTVETGTGKDVINLRKVAVAGKTKLKTGGGHDSLLINAESVFTGTFSADLGTGDDLVSIAQTPGFAAPVQFNSKATIKTGDGNDTLQLGVNAGDAGQVATFVAGTIDGGTGRNLFDDELANFTVIVLGTDIVNWEDPT